MFVGHLSLAFAGKTISRDTPLAWLMAAACLVDLLWPLFLLAGVERVRIDPGNTAFTPLAFDYYPWTHSLLTGFGWGAALALAARRAGVSRTGAWLAGALVVSHWGLDFASHRADLPLWPWGADVYGLDLWRSIPATLVVEGAMWFAALALFLRVRRPRGVNGWLALGSFVLLCTVIWASGPFSPPPPSERALALVALIGGWTIVPWTWWIDRTSAFR